MKAKVGNVGARLKTNGMGWTMVACLFVESEEELQSGAKSECWEK